MSYAYPMDSILTYDDNGVPQYDRAINSAQLRELYHELLSDGVLLNNSTNLQVVANSTMNVTVKAGLCNIQGCIKKFEEDIEVTIESASTSYNRIDTIVARLDLNSDYRDIGIFVKKGTPASVPTRPELTRDTNVYEIALADLTISANATTLSQSNISDTRLDTNRCGIISCIAEFDTTKLYEQIQADLKQFQESNEADFEQWFEHMKEQLGEDAAGNLQLQIDAHTEKSVPSENGAHGFRYFEGRMQAHIYDEESQTLKWVNVPYAIDENLAMLESAVGFTKKNLLNNNLTTQTVNGITYTVNADKSITVNGTATADSNIKIDVYAGTDGLEIGNKYILSGVPKGVTGCCMYLINSNVNFKAEDFGDGAEFTFPEIDIIYFVILVNSGTTLNNVTFYPMIRYASIENDSYEPYQGLSVSEELAMVKSAVGYEKKQLIPYPFFQSTVTKQNLEWKDNGDGTITVNGTPNEVSGYGMVDSSLGVGLFLKAGKYILNGCPNGGSAATYHIMVSSLNDLGDRIYHAYDYGEGAEFIITKEKEVNVSISIRENMIGVPINNLVFKPMIRPAEIKDDTFEQYQKDLKTQVGDMHYLYLSTDNTNYNNKPWEVIRENWGKFNRMSVYGGIIFCSSRFCFLGFRYVNALYGAFIVFNYSQNKLYHVIQSNGKWSYSVISSNYTDF